MKLQNILAFLSLLLFFTLSAGCLQPAHPVPAQDNHLNPPQAPVAVSGHMNITRPGLYYLTTDLTPSGIRRGKPGDSGSSEYQAESMEKFIVIRSSDVIFDGMGHTIDGKKLAQKYDNTVGLSIVYPPDNTTSYLVIIRNVTLSNWSIGVLIRYAKDSRLENSRLSGNGDGIILQSSSNISLAHNIFSNNNGVLNGFDVEEIHVSDNTFTDNKGNGISLSGDLEIPLTFNPTKYIQTIWSRIPFAGNGDFPFQSTLSDKYYYLYSFHRVQKTTSGSGFVITGNNISGSLNGISLSDADYSLVSNNNIRNPGSSGILLRKVSNSTISENTITGFSHYGIRTENRGPNLIVANNTYSGNGENERDSRYPESFPVSVLLGTLLIYLMKLAAGTSAVYRKIQESRFYKWIKGKTQSLEVTIRSLVQGRGIFKRSNSPVFITIAGAIIFGGAFAFAKSVVSFDVFCIFMIISGIVTVIPRAIQYLTAKKYELPLEYRMWWGGIIIILITMVIPGIVFGQPVRTDLEQEEKFDTRKVAVTKLAGPAICILLSIGFSLVYIVNGPYAASALEGLKMSLLSAFVMLLPISPLEGVGIKAWNKYIWTGLFLPVMIAYLCVLMFF
jgi:parallel beta-helix repeat protein